MEGKFSDIARIGRNNKDTRRERERERDVEERRKEKVRKNEK